ncbi:lytic transglycosylase domain-containing protein [Burkholderia sp. SCN-KJ]|uniref:lytic transglycosylase domain-containing protein n=1 Tax=Burkholderia sp. SCN-KJ TaxID=2969248 RepID=UPI00214F9F9E|nr:lytic transglycosylase domain-containing protein [Burkholderia sp. SCN-KJ]MCR4464828.1 lytic transglycosylase domain-containing protein [Burkholderia sp. SCN-KJ]
MPIDSLYADQTASFLSGQNQIDVPEPRTYPSTSITSIARAVGRGLGQGGTALFGAASDLAAGLSQVYVDPDTLTLNPQAQADADKQVNAAIAKQRAGHLFESPLGTKAYDLSDTFKPDPTRATTIDQTVQGVVSGLTQIVPAAVLGGPLAGAAVGGTSIGMSRAEDLKRQGVDVGTRTAVGAVEGALTAAGAVLPVAGSTVARTAGLVAAGGPGAAIAQATIEKAILRNADYDHLADQIDPLDPVNIAASTLMAGAFAGAHTAATARAARQTAAAAALPLESMAVDARKALPYNAPQLDAYAAQAAQREGVPHALLDFIKNHGERSNSDQVSSAGAKGVMQFTKDTWAAYGKGDPQDPVNSIDAAARYAKDLLQRYDGDMRAAVTEYNGGVEQARAVQAGGSPTAKETIGYLKRFDEYVATRGIDSATFHVTPDQVDAALLARGQRIVDDAYVFGTPGDIAAMTAHQDAFELAARQMDAGQFPDVVHYFTSDDVTRATALDGLIADAESYRGDLASTSANLADPGAVAQARAELDQLRANAPDTSPEGIKELTRQLQDQGAKYKAAAAEAQRRIDASRADHEAQVARLEGMIRQNAEAQRASEQLPTLDSQIEQMRTARARIDAPATRRTQIADFVSSLARAQREADRTPVTQPRNVIAESAAETGVSPGSAPRATTTPAASVLTAHAIEANVRELAAQRPDMQVTIDTPAGERRGTVAELLRQIDDEHTMNTQDAGLFEVAARCFISTL